ncbi:TorD/DmsD family molecular chaperone [Clostridium arbusti]|uniref:TorD/DmsD family molecular chaperone n=1 Tax=Clostridium arbusti TaxID=1137848 RepID=UPI00028A088F|nr:molecular chaperone TorD family protein [Clostridium arbusti]
MMNEKESIEILIANRTYLYRIFQNVFGTDPSEKQLKVVTANVTINALKLLDTKDNHAMVNAAEYLKSIAYGLNDDFIEKIKTEYTKLLIGPEKMPAPPWESVYITKERILFRESTLEVRKIYMKYGIVPTRYLHVADDHIALELDFMYILSMKIQEAFENENMERVIELLNEQKDFLQYHLQIWIPDFAKQMQKSNSKLYYPEMADILKEFLRIDYDTIIEILDNIKNIVPAINA